MEYIFFTGAPGSRWSGVSQVFRDTWDNIDNTDLVPEKTYKHPLYKGHVGNYYGPGMLNGTWLDQYLGSKQEWRKEIDQSFTGSKPVKLILSHHFAYWLKELIETFPSSKLVLCYRTDQECFDWWHNAGGWDISYPSYSWYQNDTKMMNEIQKQNTAILDFINKNKLILEQPSIDFFRKYFNVDKDFIFNKDIKLAVYNND